MTCVELGKMQAYIDGELTPSEMAEVTAHIQRCAACQHQLVEVQQLNGEQVVLQPINMKQAWRSFEQVATPTVKRRITMKRMMYAAAVAASLMVTATLPPVQAAMTNLWSAVTGDTVINEGIRNEDGTTQNMMKNGKLVPVSFAVTNNGLTLTIKEAYIADSRLSVRYEVTDETGAVVKKATLQGNDLPFELMQDGKAMTQLGVRDKDGVMSFVEVPDSKASFKQPVTLVVNVTQIGTVKGTWNGTIDLQR